MAKKSVALLSNNIAISESRQVSDNFQYEQVSHRGHIVTFFPIVHISSLHLVRNFFFNCIKIPEDPANMPRDHLSPKLFPIDLVSGLFKLNPNVLDLIYWEIL